MTTTPIPAAGTDGPFVELRPIPEKPKPTLQFKSANGKTYEIIKLRQRIGGKGNEWQEIDLSKLSDSEKEELTASAVKASEVFGKLDGAPQELIETTAFTLRFNQEHDLGPGLMHSIIGTLFKSCAWKPQPKLLQTITYKTSDNEEKTFTVNIETYAPEDQEEIFQTTYPLTKTIRELAKNGLPSKKLKKSTPSQSPNEVHEEPAVALATAIQDAGNRDNKCAARAIAMIMKSQGNPSTIDELSEELIQDSKDKIQDQDEFKTLLHPNYSAIVAALDNYYGAHSAEKPQDEDLNDPAEVRATYLSLLNKENFMLDAPFFLTLEKPTFILEKVDENFKIKEIVQEVKFKKLIGELSLEDFKTYQIVLHDDTEKKHYQAVIPTKQAHAAALRAIFQAHFIPA